MTVRNDTSLAPATGLGVAGRLARAFQDNALTPLLALVALLLGLFAVLVLSLIHISEPTRPY